MKGYTQLYTGDGKGKTTAALGLLVRAVGAGLHVYVGQFIKAGDYSEIRTLRERFPEVTLEQYGRGRFVVGEPSPEDIQAARDGLARLSAAMTGGEWDVVIADEIAVAVDLGLLPVDDVLALIDRKPDAVELVLTGRNAHPRIQEAADLVSRIDAVKHYFDDGVDARPGIEA